jgi:hypothetical protein
MRNAAGRREEGILMDEKTKETLQKQLQLLSERSQNAESGMDLAELTYAMCEVAALILNDFVPEDSNGIHPDGIHRTQAANERIKSRSCAFDALRSQSTISK